MKKIAVLNTSLGFGGVEKVLVNFLNEISKHEVEIDLFLFKSDDAFLQQLDKTINVFFVCDYLSFKKMLKSLFLSHNYIRCVCAVFNIVLHKLFNNRNTRKIFNYYRFYQLVTNRRYDIAIAYKGTEEHLLYLLIYKIVATKKIAWIHGSGYSVEQSYLFNKMDKIFCVSLGVMKDFSNKIPCIKNKVDVFYNIVNLNDIINKSKETISDIDAHSLILVTVGRLSYEKGCTMIPDIASLLVKDGYNFKWYIIGDGPQKDHLHQLINTNNVANNVILLGSRANPYPYFACCDIYVQPSFSEGFCTATMEAKILKRLIVTTNVFGANEQFINKKNGIIVNEFDPKSIYLGIKSLLDDFYLREEIKNSLDDFVLENDIAKFFLLLNN